MSNQNISESTSLHILSSTYSLHFSKLSSSVTLFLNDGTKVKIKGNTIDKENSKFVFERAGKIKKIECIINNIEIDKKGTI